MSQSQQQKQVDKDLHESQQLQDEANASHHMNREEAEIDEDNISEIDEDAVIGDLTDNDQEKFQTLFDEFDKTQENFKEKFSAILVESTHSTKATIQMDYMLHNKKALLPIIKKLMMKNSANEGGLQRSAMKKWDSLMKLQFNYVSTRLPSSYRV